MARLLVDATTGTVLDIENCYIVDDQNLSDENKSTLENGSDSEIGALAIGFGKRLVTIGNDTGWGDNAYKFTVSYSPLSIKDEADALLDGGVYEDDPDIKDALMWVRDIAETEDLETIAYSIMSNDGVWDGYRNNAIESIMFVYREIQREDEKNKENN